MFPDSPLKGKPVNKREGDFDVSTELEGFGLQGIRVTEDDLAALVQELGLGGDDADELVKGLSGPPKKAEPEKSDPQVALMAELSTKLKPAAKPQPPTKTTAATSATSETKAEIPET